VRALVAAGLGLAFGAWVAACSCGPHSSHPELTAGTVYRVDAQNIFDDLGVSTDYRLTVAADRKSLMETFTRSGKAYQVTYVVTGSRESH
jgi:hypothetical protein